MKKYFLILLVGLFMACGTQPTQAQSSYSVSYYRTGKTYKLNDLVSNSGIIYKALLATTNAPPHADWININSTGGGGVGNIADGTVVGNMTIWNGTTWVQTAAITSDDTDIFILNDLAVTGNITGANLSGSNSGDQTSIVGITGTKAEFDAAVTDGDILYVGDVVETDPIFVAEESDILKTNEIKIVTSQLTFDDVPLMNATTAEIDLKGNLSSVNARWVFDKTTASPLTTKGDVFTYDTGSQRLGVGSNGEVLTADSAEPTGLKWAAGGGGASPLTTKGDLYSYSTVDARLPLGTDYQVLMVDTFEPTGMFWSELNALDVVFDNTSSGMLAENVEEALDEIIFDYFPLYAELVASNNFTGTQNKFKWGIRTYAGGSGATGVSVRNAAEAQMLDLFFNTTTNSTLLKGYAGYMDIEATNGDINIRPFTGEINLDATVYSSMTDGDITTKGATALITKSYGDANYLGGGSPLTTKGDLFTYDTGDQRLAVGINGQVLEADSAEPTGVKWATPASGVTDHTLLSNIGVKTHAEIDSYIANNVFAVNGISTGLHDGGLLSINISTTTYDVAAGSGIIVDNITDPDNPTVTHVDWIAKTNQSPTSILTQLVTYISINSSGNIVESTSPPSATNRRDDIYLGVIIHSNNVNVNAVNQLPVVAIDVGAQVQDILNLLGFQSTSGNVMTFAAADLTIQKTVGIGFKAGANYQTLKSQPHEFAMAALNPVTFRYRNQDGTESGDLTSIDPTTWDNNGTTTTVANTSNATIQRVFIFPSNQIRIQRGQQEFGNFSTALNQAGTESFIVETNIAENGLFLGSIVTQKNTTDLSDTTEAVFITPTGVVSSSSVNTTLQASYDVSAPPQITTDAALGELIIQRGTAADTDKVFAIKNGAGTETFGVDGNGNINTSGLVDGVDMSDVGLKSAANTWADFNYFPLFVLGDGTLVNPSLKFWFNGTNGTTNENRLEIDVSAVGFKYKNQYVWDYQDGTVLESDVNTVARLDAETVTSKALITKEYAEINYAGGGLANIVEDLTPELGGQLDAGSNRIVFNPLSSAGIGTSPHGANDGSNIFFFQNSINLRSFDGANISQVEVKFDGTDTDMVFNDLTNSQSGILSFDGGTDGFIFENVTGGVSVPDEVYGVGWNSSLEVPTKNAVYDKMELISGGGMTDLVDDATPQLGGDLDTQGFAINSLGITTSIGNTKAGTGIVGTGYVNFFSNEVKIGSYDTAITYGEVSVDYDDLAGLELKFNDIGNTANGSLTYFGLADGFIFKNVDVVSLDGAELQEARMHIGTYTGTDTVLTGEMNQVFHYTGASAGTLTLPDTLTELDGSWITIVTEGAGTVTIAVTGTATLNGVTAGSIVISGRYKAVTLSQRVASSDDWIAIGAY